MWKHFQFIPQIENFSWRTDIRLNEFDILLRSEWDRALDQGLFTFRINEQMKQRILEGNLHYILELNSARNEKRRMPYPFEHVNTPFDRNKFNFNKIKDDEILFSLDNEKQTDQHLVIINNSPIRPYHVLLVPQRQLEQTQILTVDCILFGLEFITSSSHPFVYVGFNSLCGQASINHLHIHGLYMSESLFLQTIKCSPFHTNVNCYLFDSINPQGFVFEIKHVDEFSSMAQHIYRVTQYLTCSNIAHNLSIVKGDSFSSLEPALRVFIWFRQSCLGAKVFDRCNFACLELSGYMFVQSEDFFNNLTEDEIRREMNDLALPSDVQDKIREDVKNLFNE